MGSVLLDLGGRLWRVDEGAEDHKQLLAKGAELVGEKPSAGPSDGGPSVKELRAQADELGIPKSVKKRDDLVAAIAEAQESAGTPGDGESDVEGETLGE